MKTVLFGLVICKIVLNPCLFFEEVPLVALESLKTGAVLPQRRPTSDRGCPRRYQNRFKGTPPEVPKNRSQQKRATAAINQATCSKMGANISTFGLFWMIVMFRCLFALLFDVFFVGGFDYFGINFKMFMICLELFEFRFETLRIL